MQKGDQHTAVWKDETYKLSQTGWSKLVGHSRTFIRDMMEEAEKNGLTRDKWMQYAIEQTPGERNFGGKLGRKSNNLNPGRERRENSSDRINVIRGREREKLNGTVNYLIVMWPATKLHHGKSAEVV